MQAGTWVSLRDSHDCGQVLETITLWGETRLRLWLPSRQSVVTLSPDRVCSLDEHPASRSQEALAYLTAAARVSEALTQEILLAPIGAPVIPLPHQLHALGRALSGPRLRYLLADEVGLGKTIEAGLILRELKLRGLARRVLIVAPAGLVNQWVAEMATHFHESFRLVLSSDLQALERWGDTSNPWANLPQVVTTLDGIKPLERRRGWSPEQIAEYNRKRLEDVVSAGWDLIIVDEAHRLGGSTEEVARYQLGKALSEAAPYLLLLSATPHQGKTEAFLRLLGLLDPLAFPDPESLTTERVRPYVIRTEKRQAVDAEGQPLFQPRRTELRPVPWEARHQAQRRLYEAATDYARTGYNRAMALQARHIGFLMVLMQRLVSSSTRAFAATVAKRLEVVRELVRPQAGPSDEVALWDADGETQLEWVLGVDPEGHAEEVAELETLLEAAKVAEATGPDPKAEALNDLLQELQQEEGDPELKLLVFTEFVPTQQMLAEFLTERGVSVATLNGSLSLDERKDRQSAFAGGIRVLISTEAGGEGLNLQFAHLIVNYDLPWNPMRIEQRIGRVDRIGQTQVVRAFNFVLADTVEHRVREVLEDKLQIILQEFGVDKTGDVLDSAEAERLFTRAFTAAQQEPEQVDAQVEALCKEVRNAGHAHQLSSGLLGSEGQQRSDQCEALRDHPIFHWLERMVVAYCQSHGGKAEAIERKSGTSWRLTWPDGERLDRCVFAPQQAARDPRALHLTLENPLVRGLSQRRWIWAPGQPIPLVLAAEIPSGVCGHWSLWRVGLRCPASQVSDGVTNLQRVMAVFRRDDGKVFQPTARRLWDVLIAGDWISGEAGSGADSQVIFEQLRPLAEEQGAPLFRRIRDQHRQRIQAEREKGDRAFEVRRAALQRIGLEQVRNHRLRALDAEEAEWREDLRAQEDPEPELQALVVLKVEGAG